jgi:hypothetical protein
MCVCTIVWGMHTVTVVRDEGDESVGPHAGLGLHGVDNGANAVVERERHRLKHASRLAIARRAARAASQRSTCGLPAACGEVAWGLPVAESAHALQEGVGGDERGVDC